MAAGNRRYLLRVESVSLADDESGQPIETWSRFCSRYGDVEAVGGNERFRGHQINASITHVIELIADSVTRRITAGMRVIVRGRTINVKVARPLEGKMRAIQILGEENAPQ